MSDIPKQPFRRNEPASFPSYPSKGERTTIQNLLSLSRNYISKGRVPCEKVSPPESAGGFSRSQQSFPAPPSSLSEEANESRWRHHDETHPTTPPQNAIHGPASDLCDTRPWCDRAAACGGIYGRAERAAGKHARTSISTRWAMIRRSSAHLPDSSGAERVLADTDWPILAALDQKSLAASLAETGLNAAEQRPFAGGNARRLLGLREAKAEAAE
ncbi:hypothetical protein [Rhizobium phaseoli]|uniref:hypothetical protein n=1 Tax=Rhizobium phaseoli TaxID=396 RepID=UPI001237085E|nr:hypothetical protein [Rhizobium phaseoli]